MNISRIVVTGGPCAGKTTAQSWIQNTFAQKGYVVLFVPETATELITGGVAPWTCGTNLDYQLCQVDLQLAKEDVFIKAAKSMGDKKILIVHDRGILDNKAYMEQADFDEVVQAVGSSELALRDRYDAVFHLVTAADGAEAFYTTANNTARRETPDQAIALDRKLLDAWTGHPYLRIIDNSTGFEGKIQRLLHQIASFLGEPELYSQERKFIIGYPDLDWLEKASNIERVEIIQTNLKPNSRGVSRIRQRGLNGNYIYYEVTKIAQPDGNTVEVERRLKQDEYLSLLMEADTTQKQLRKTRYYLTYKNQYFEIDVYPGRTDKAMASIKVIDKETPIFLPEEISIICETDNDGEFLPR